MASKVVGLDSFVLSNFAAAEAAIKEHLNLSSVTSLNRLLSDRGYKRATTNRHAPNMTVTYSRGAEASQDLD